MTVCIQFVAMAGPNVTPSGLQPGMLLKHFDTDAHGGRGHAAWTNDVDAAMKFSSHLAALACWRQQSRLRPFRPDGKPNRPLTAFSVQLLPVEDDSH